MIRLGPTDDSFRPWSGIAAATTLGDVVLRLDPDAVLGMCTGDVGGYVHVPFCEWICPFCPYNKVRAREDLARRYFAGLALEMAGYRDALERSGRRSFTSLYIGGGTPTLYPEHLAAVIAAVPTRGERAVEVLPSHGTPQRLDRLAEIGVTAVSIGAQSFHDRVLRVLHRPHDAAASLDAVRNALSRFDVVDVDLIVDSAWEDDADLRGSFLADVRRCFSLGVDQVSTYPLMRFGYTPFGTARHDRRREHTLLAQVSDMAASMGYERRSVWTFNRVDAPAYTSITRPRFIGMGAGSASFTGGDFFVNHFGLTAYLDDIDAGRLPIARWLHLGAMAGAAYDAFWQAYAGQVSPTDLRAHFGTRAAMTAWLVLRPLLATGLVERDDGRYRLTRTGFDAYHDLERWVTYQFIEPLWGEMLAEHAALPVPDEGADWVDPTRARHGRLWTIASAVFERPRADAVVG